MVGSRHAADRADLHQRLTAALRAAATTAIDPPAFTVGDEFQGSYQTVGDAIDAALRMRLAVAPGIDVRFGIGWGEVTVLDEQTRIQDGPAWWAAREAIAADGDDAAATRLGAGAHDAARGTATTSTRSTPR